MTKATLLARFCWCVLALVLMGCGGGLDVRLVNSAAAKPNNVWVFFTITKGGEPVGGLYAEDFSIFEDDKSVSQYESKQSILNPELAAVQYTLLLLDMSGSVSESGEKDRLVDAATAFSERVGKSQKVAIYVFDGSAKIHSITPFTAAKGSVKGGIQRLKNFKPKDPSTNLNGAVVEGLRELKKGLDKEKLPLKFGSLVVFTDGTDQAARVSREDMAKELDEETYALYDVYAIGVGAEMQQDDLETIGRSGFELASDGARIQGAFDKIAARVEAKRKSFYLLSYCTPARAGKHFVRIEAKKRGAKSDDFVTGTVEYEFDAAKFGPPPECNPERKPSFKLEDNQRSGDGNGGGKTGVKAGVTVNGS